LKFKSRNTVCQYSSVEGQAVTTVSTFWPKLSLFAVDLSGLHLTGQSVAPVYKDRHDHANPRRPEESGARTLDKKNMPEQTVFVRKERQGFGGGFKILEEYRNKKMARKSAYRKTDDEDDVDIKDQN